MDSSAEECWSEGEHGWKMTLDGQRVYRAVLAFSEARGGVSEGA
jgi:hypothetical protein